MFNRSKAETERPRPLGEDVFPTLDDYPAPDAAPTLPVAANEAQEDAATPTATSVQLSILATRIAAFTDEQWRRTQLITGVALGIASSLFIVLPEDGASGLPVLGAAGLALLVPRLLETLGKRNVGRLRKTLIITLGVCMGAYIIYLLIAKPETLFTR